MQGRQQIKRKKKINWVIQEFPTETITHKKGGKIQKQIDEKVSKHKKVVIYLTQCTDATLKKSP